MKKTILSLSMILALVLAMSFAVSAVSYQNQFIDYDVTVVNPFVRWLGEPGFGFVVDTTEKLDDIYLNTGSFGVRSTTTYGVGVQILTPGTSWDAVVLNAANPNVKSGQKRDIFSIQATDGDGDFSNWIRPTGGTAGHLPKGIPNTLGIAGPLKNERIHGLKLALVLVDDVDGELIPRVQELPNGTYTAQVRIWISEDL